MISSKNQMKILKNKKYSILKAVMSYGFILTIAVSFLMPMMIVRADSATPPVVVETTIDNPLGSGNLEDIPSFIEAIIRIILTVGVPIVTLAIIYSGFLFVEVQGNPEKLKKAKSALMVTLIGAALLLGAWVLAEAIGATVDDIKRTT